MFIKRHISLPLCEDRHFNGWFKADDFNLLFSAQKVLDEANDLATQRLKETQNQCEQLIADAKEQAKVEAQELTQSIEQQTWQQSSEWLNQLKESEALMWESIEQHCSNVLNQILNSWCKQASNQEKLSLMMEKIMATQKHYSQGTMYCSSDIVAQAQALLAQREDLPWQVKEDSRLSNLQVRLDTAGGVFDCQWASIEQGLLSLVEPETEEIDETSTL